MKVIVTWSGLSRLKMTRISVAVTQSCNTGECSNSNADGRPSNVANATRFGTEVNAWVLVHNASCIIKYGLTECSNEPVAIIKINN